MVFYVNNILSLGGGSRTSDFIHKDFMTRARHFSDILDILDILEWRMGAESSLTG